MKGWKEVFFGVFIGLLSAGVIVLVISRPRGKPITLAAPPTAAPLVVYVTGEVNQTGVYTLPAGSRVKDALDAAGGPLPGANMEGINLAAPLQDGVHLHVQSSASPNPTVSGSRPDYPAQAPQGTITPGPAPVNLNLATQADLETLPGIGPTRAQQILAYRQDHGPFIQVEELLEIPGIGPATLEKLKPFIIISP